MAFNVPSILTGFILAFFIFIGIVLYIKQFKIQMESKRIEKESERLAKLAKEDKPYEDFTSGHLYK